LIYINKGDSHMATKIAIKRTSVAGRTPNTSILDTGELALNITDQKLFSSDGTNIFELGANLSSLSVSNTVTSTGLFPVTDNTGAVGNAALTWNSGQFTNLTVDSTLSVRAAIDLADSDVLRYGSSDDLRTFYNGTTNYWNVEMEAACIGIRFTDDDTDRIVFDKVTGDITSTGDITAFFSDERLKDRYDNISNPVDKVKTLNGFYYEPNEIAQSLGYEKKMYVGLSAQEVQSILPEVIKPAPVDNKYLTVDYAKLVPLLVEAIKEQQEHIERLESKIDLLGK
jgi:hypothetical protein